MNKLLLSLLSIISFCNATAQHQTDNWYFGLMAGINFGSGNAIAQYGGMTSNTEGCSSISDASGNLLFYTDGVYVWNKNHQQMPNGYGLHGSTSSTQSALIVPKPGSATLYYIFTVDETGGPNGFEYSVVDMTLDGGLGDVDTLNVHILNYVTEKLTAVQQDNTGNYWVAVHEWGSDAFYVYLLTAAGLQAPVISHTGIVHNDSMIQYTYGQMKFNACGNMIGAAMGYMDTVQVFLFDNATGIISNPFTIPIGAHCYGLEFSPNGTKVYVSTYDELGTLVQYNLDVLNEDSILASKIILTTEADIYALQLASDGKIYVCKAWSSHLGAVNYPDIGGFNCIFDLLALDLDPSFNGVMSALGLPGFVTSWLMKGGECIVTSAITVNSVQQSFTVYPNPCGNEFYIRIETEGNTKLAELKILDMAGRQVYIETLSFMKRQKNIKVNLASGLYLISLKMDNNQILTKKLVVE